MVFDSEENFKIKREAMVREQIEDRGIRDERVRDSLRSIPRHFFVLPQDRESAYEDCPLPIGFGQTISQPYMVAFMVEQLHLMKKDRVLEIGTGSGYAAAVMAELSRTVYTIEVVKELYERSTRLLKNLGHKNIICRLGDGYNGWQEEAPFDKIVLTAAPEQMPHILLDQLVIGGKLIAPIGPIKLFQRLMLYEKLAANNYKETELMGVSFVEMVHDSEM